MWAKLAGQLSREVDGASLAVVRMVTAAALFVLSVGVLVTGRVPELFMSLGVNFQYPLATFVKPLPGNLPYAHMVIVALTAFAVFVGWRTRLNAWILCAASVYWFLLDPLYYSDGYYLLALMSILVAWLPVNRWMSADRQLGREKRSTVWGWQPALVKFQLLVVYVFSGLFKVNSDWLSGAPLAARFAVAGSAVDPSMAAAIAWGVMLLQLSVGFLLLWRRSRVAGLLLMTVLHAADGLWLHVGVAPVLMWALSFVFCDPAWPRRLVERIAPAVARLPLARSLWNGTRRLGATVESAFAWFDDSPVFKKRSPARRSGTRTAEHKTRDNAAISEFTKYCVAAWMLIQLILPLRYLAYPGTPRWTDEGRLFAWWGDTFDKQGDLTLTLILPDRQLMWQINPGSNFPLPLEIIFSQAELERRGLAGGMLQDIVLASDDEVMRELVQKRIDTAGLSNEDVRQLDDASVAIARLQLNGFERQQISLHPELLRQYCVAVADTAAAISPGNKRPIVTAQMTASLNGRDLALCIPEESQLSEESFSLAPIRWIIPLDEELPPAEQRIAFVRSQQGDFTENTVESAPSANKSKLAEPTLAPGISEADEQWFQAAYPAE